MNLRIAQIFRAAGLLFALTFGPAHATGVLPETSVVLVNEDDGEGTLNVKNTEPTPVLLNSTVEPIALDPVDYVIVAPPLVRVEAGQTQLVRFILKNKTPLETEHMMRALFEGIPSVDAQSSKSRVGVIIRQDVPLIVHPAKLKANAEPWKLLKWYAEGKALVVRNDSPYIAFISKVEVQPQQVELNPPSVVILPGHSLTMKSEQALEGAARVKVYPLSYYGRVQDPYEKSLESGPAPAEGTPAAASADPAPATAAADVTPAADAGSVAGSVPAIEPKRQAP